MWILTKKYMQTRHPSRLAIVFFGALSLNCTAADVDLGRINVELYGVVTTSTCGVLESNKDKYISLGHYATQDLKQVGNRTAAIPIPFQLANCPANDTIHITFNGEKDSINNELLALEKNSHKAQNIAIEISDPNKKRLALGQKSEPLTADRNGQISTIFYANYIVTKASATAGVANAQAEFTIQYD